MSDAPAFRDTTSQRSAPTAAVPDNGSKHIRSAESYRASSAAARPRRYRARTYAEDATAGGKEVILVPCRSGVGEGDLVGTLERVESENLPTGNRVLGISLTG